MTSLKNNGKFELPKLYNNSSSNVTYERESNRFVNSFVKLCRKSEICGVLGGKRGNKKQESDDKDSAEEVDAEKAEV